MSSIFILCSYNFDYHIYNFLNIRSSAEYIDHAKGAFRSNLLPLDILHGNEKKVIFVGSSFTTCMGNYKFKVKGEDFKSGSVGIAGNSLINGLRTATTIIDVPHLHTIILG